jgi:hypothetical protein
MDSIFTFKKGINYFFFLKQHGLNNSLILSRTGKKVSKQEIPALAFALSALGGPSTWWIVKVDKRESMITVED